jgi:hypothetical protein
MVWQSGIQERKTRRDGPAAVSPGRVHRLSMSLSSRPESLQDSTNVKDVHRIEAIEAAVKPLRARSPGIELLSLW